MTVRTDLAEESHSLWQQEAAHTTSLPGVRARQWEENGIPWQQVDILDEEGARALGKPMGTYHSFQTGPDSRVEPELVDSLSHRLRNLLNLAPHHKVLVVGLGNEALTPDALGPRTARQLLVTRHLRQTEPALFGDLREVSVLTPGVLATTGMESAQVVASLVGTFRPDRVLVVDALAAASPDRLCRTLQLTDAGIVPGSGVGNSRHPLSQTTLGVPVVALGAATVLDAGTQETPLLVTHRDADLRIRRLSSLISQGINCALFDNLTKGEIAQFLDPVGA